MDPVKLVDFVDEAEKTMRTLRSAVLINRQESRTTEIGSQTERIGSLRESAARLGLDSVHMVLDAVAEQSFSLSHGAPLTDTETRTLLDLISHAEAEIIKLRLSGDDQMFDPHEFIDRSFDILQLDGPVGTEQKAEPPPAEPQGEDEFEPDAEMLEIFSIEAEDLLGGIDSNLDVLRAAPDNRDALWEVRRHAHTFKGAAGIIGLKKPSALAHRIEDLLDRLAQTQTVPGAKVLDLIVRATELLRALTKGEASVAVDARTAEIYAAFDETLRELSDPSAVKPEVVNDDREPAEIRKTAAPAGEPAASRPIVRVSINRLDDLAGTVRDLLVSRSVVEQRFAEFELQLEALGRITKRLQAASARIENDFEATTLDTRTPFDRTHESNEENILNASESESFDSLELDRYTDFHESSRELSESAQECFAVNTSLDALRAAFDAVFSEQRRLIEETQEKLVQIRLIRFGSLETRLHRVVRVTCEEEDRKAEIVIENPDVELDTDVLDSLVEPLMHLVRNAVVHGIEPPEMRRLVGKPETGRITVSVANEETHVELRVRDDGRGIAVNMLKAKAVEAGLIEPDEALSLDHDGILSLMFLPGLTTAEKLSMSAGRGVGMSIVRESVESRNGIIAVETAVQHGTTFVIRIPLAFAFAQVLLVRSGSNLSAVPVRSVRQIKEVSPKDIRTGPNGPAIRIDSADFPVRFLADHFSETPTVAGVDALDVLQIENSEGRYALAVDEILRTEEIAIKPLGKPLDSVGGMLGAAMLGDGAVVPVLDIAYFMNAEPVAPSDFHPASPAEVKPLILIVDDSPSVRHMTSKMISAAGWDVVTAKDGAEALEMLSGPALPDLILTDVEMPRIDGYELVAAVRNREFLNHIPVVFITSRASDKHREKAAELGVSEYLTKPFVESELLQTVERLTLCQEPALI